MLRMIYWPLHVSTFSFVWYFVLKHQRQSRLARQSSKNVKDKFLSNRVHSSGWHMALAYLCKAHEVIWLSQTVCLGFEVLIYFPSALGLGLTFMLVAFLGSAIYSYILNIFLLSKKSFWVGSLSSSYCQKYFKDYSIVLHFHKTSTGCHGFSGSLSLQIFNATHLLGFMLIIYVPASVTLIYLELYRNTVFMSFV